MIISLTGHTSGLGLAIAKYFHRETIIGFSRSNGYDIQKYDNHLRIADESMLSDVFINNAYHAMAQVNLLYIMYDRWKDDNTKTILNISSLSADGIKSFRHPYSIHKNALDKASEQLQNTDAKCKILNLKPGYIDTPMVSHMNDTKKLTSEYVAGIAGWMITQTDGVIKTLTVTPYKY